MRVPCVRRACSSLARPRQTLRGSGIVFVEASEAAVDAARSALPDPLHCDQYLQHPDRGGVARYRGRRPSPAVVGSKWSRFAQSVAYVGLLCIGSGDPERV
jgi:hypothetical protein